MPVGEGDDHSVGGQVGQARQGIRDERRFGLLAVGDDRRTGGLEALDGLPHHFLLQGPQLLVAEVPGGVGGHGLLELGGPGDAPDGFGGDGHGYSFLGVSHKMCHILWPAGDCVADLR